MSSLWKLKQTTPLAPEKSSGTPLDFVQCIGKALLQPRSEVARHNNTARRTPNQVRRKQIRYTIRSRSACFKSSSKHENTSMLSIDPRSGTVNVDKWSQSELSEWDINRISSGGGRIFSLGPIFDGTSAPSCPGPKPPMRIRNSRMSKPFRIPSAASRSANVSRVTTARTQRLHDFKTDTLQDSQSQLRADTSLKSIDLGQHRKSVHVWNGGLKPLKPVGAQRPSIFQCTGITPDPTKNVHEKYHQGDNTAPVFKRFYEVMLEEPQRRRQDRQRSAHTSGTFGGHMDDEHLETATSGYCLEVPSCSPNTLQLQLEGLCLQGEWGQLGGGKRCSSLPTSHPVKETFFKSMASNDSHKDAGCASGRKIEDTSKEDCSKDTADPFINKWDPGQLKVTFTLKDSNEQMIKSGLQKPSSS